MEEQCGGLLAEVTGQAANVAKVRGAIAAATTGGVPVVIASWADPAALGALATGGRRH